MQVLLPPMPQLQLLMPFKLPEIRLNRLPMPLPMLMPKLLPELLKPPKLKPKP